MLYGTRLQIYERFVRGSLCTLLQPTQQPCLLRWTCFASNSCIIRQMLALYANCGGFYGAMRFLPPRCAVFLYSSQDERSHDWDYGKNYAKQIIFIRRKQGRWVGHRKIALTRMYFGIEGAT